MELKGWFVERRVSKRVIAVQFGTHSETFGNQGCLEWRRRGGIVEINRKNAFNPSV